MPTLALALALTLALALAFARPVNAVAAPLGTGARTATGLRAQWSRRGGDRNPGHGLRPGTRSAGKLHRRVLFMVKRAKLTTAAALAIGTCVAGAALAQDSQRIEITGSSIKRLHAGQQPVPGRF
jgi:hypothetical protein